MRLKKLSGTVLAESRDNLAGTFTGRLRLFVVESLVIESAKIFLDRHRSSRIFFSVTHFDDRIVEANLSEKLNTRLLDGVGESKTSLVTGSLVGNEKGGEVERAFARRCSSGSSRSH